MSAADIIALQKRAVHWGEAFAAVVEHAKVLGLECGKPGRGSVACPVCDHGTIKYRVKWNGVLRGACTMPNCVRFYE